MEPIHRYAPMGMQSAGLRVQWPPSNPDEEAALRAETAILLGFALIACDSPPEAPPLPMRLVGASGHVRAGQAVVPRFSKRVPPVIRVDGEPGPLAISLSAGETTALVAFSVEDGAGSTHLLRVEMPDGFDAAAAELVVAEGDRVLHRLPMRWGRAPVPARYADLKGLDDATRLDRLETPPPAGPAEIRWAGFARGRLLQRMGRQADAVEAFRASARGATAEGEPGEAAKALRMAAMVELQQARLAPAEALLDEARIISDGIDDRAGRSTVRYFQAEIDRLRGALREAGVHIEQALDDATSVGRRDLADYARALQTVIRQTLGHHRDARAMLEAMAADLGDDTSNRAAVVWGNLGWVLLEGLSRGVFGGEADTRAARAALEKALVILEDALAKNAGLATEVANVHANLAALGLLVGDLKAVERHVAAYDRLDVGRKLHAGVFVDLVDARRLLAAGRFAEARSRFERIERRALAELDVTGDYVWRARLGAARARRGEGDHPGALAAFRSALTARAHGAAHTGLTDSRAAFFADHRALYDESLAAALAAGETAEAFEIADRARARLVVDLEARTRTERLSAEQKAEWTRRLDDWLARRHAFESTRGDEAMLTEAERGPWRARREARRVALQAAFDDAFGWLDGVAPIAARGATVRVVQAALAPDEALWLLHPTADGQRIHFRIRPGAVEVSRAPWSPDAAVRHRFVVDPVTPARQLTASLLPHGTLSHLTHAGQLIAPTESVSGAPLVIGDPDGTLPEARRESESVARSLPNAVSLIGAAAERDAVRRALGVAGTVHFAGHGVLTPSSPWDAHLKLAGGQRLTLEDVLLVRPRARLVLLSGCETGRRTALADDVIRLGLAQGFLAAGSASVIATDREVPDADAGRFVKRFYAADGLKRPAEALRVAALAEKAAGSPVWDAWHLWGRR